MEQAHRRAERRIDEQGIVEQRAEQGQEYLLAALALMFPGFQPAVREKQVRGGHHSAKAGDDGGLGAVRQQEHHDRQAHERRVRETRQQGEHRAFLPTPPQQAREDHVCEQVGDPVAEQDAPNHGPRHLPRFHTGKLVEQHHGQADPVDELVEAARCFYGQKPHPFNDDAKQDDAKYGNQRGKDGQHGSLGRILFVQSIRSRSYIPCAAGMQWEKRRPHRALISRNVHAAFHPLRLSFLVFSFPVGTL